VIVPGDAAAVVEKSRTFAGEIGRPPACVWLTTGEGVDDGEDHPAGWLRVVVTRRSLKRVNVPEWPLLYAGPTNYFHDEVPIGINALGDPVTAPMAYKSLSGGGIMGSGKSESMKTQVLGIASDDRVETHVHDFKGGRDWLPLARFAHVYVSGSDTADHEQILADLEDINRRLDERALTLKTMPENLAAVRTNTVLADQPGLDLHPILVVIDESQEPFEYSDYGDRYRYLIGRFVKRGRAYAITVHVATQEINKKTLPFAKICHWQHCHQTGPGYSQTDALLGDGSYRSGLHGDKLDAPGLGFFGTTGNHQLVRSYYIPGPGEDDIDDVLTPLCERLAERRRTRGLLSGMAAGDLDPDTDLEGTLDRVARVWAGDPERLHLVELLDLLHNDRPDEYPTVTVETVKGEEVTRAVNVLSGQLGRYQIVAENMRRPFLSPDARTVVRKGITWDDITTALETRHRRPDHDSRDDVEGDNGGWWDDDTNRDEHDIDSFDEGDIDRDSEGR